MTVLRADLVLLVAMTLVLAIGVDTVGSRSTPGESALSLRPALPESFPLIIPIRSRHDQAYIDDTLSNSRAAPGKDIALSPESGETKFVNTLSVRHNSNLKLQVHSKNLDTRQLFMAGMVRKQPIVQPLTTGFSSYQSDQLPDGNFSKLSIAWVVLNLIKNNLIPRFHARLPVAIQDLNTT